VSGQSGTSGTQTGGRHCEVSCYNLSRCQELQGSVDVCMISAKHNSHISTVLGKCEPSLEGRFLTSQFLVLLVFTTLLCS